MFPIQLNTNLKAHLILGILMGIWLVIFLVIVGPYDTAELPMSIRFQIMPPYGLLFVLSYVVIIPLQNWIFRRLKKWNIFLEILILSFSYFLGLLSCFQYYKSGIVNGDYSFGSFAGEIYLPTMVILSAILILGRIYISRKKTEIQIKEVVIEPQKLILRGDNKADVLQVLPADLICISSAQNYVEIHYLNNQRTQKKLLRSILKKIGQQVPDLVQVHRSYLINPTHFIAWSDTQNIQLGELIIPVSPTYKKTLLAVI
ncbi:MAG: hypothetical protein ACI9XO_001990 [Paraglaciecola sp.]|jgi:hypothetical protein